MDEYNEKRSYLKCITAYLILSFIISSIIFSFIAKLLPSSMTEEAKTSTLLLSNAIINFIVNISLSVIFIIFIRKYLKNDLKKIKENILIFIILIVTSYAFVYLNEYLCTLLYKQFNMSLTSSNQQTIVNLIAKAPILMGISVCIFGPFVEEVIFRKCIFHFFKKDSIALVVSAFAFGLIHVISALDIVRVLPYIITGFIFGGIYILSKRNIFASTIAHMLCNTISFLIILL